MIMVGPDIEGLGGISRVVRTWRENGLFSQVGIRYIPSSTDMRVNKALFLLKNLCYFTVVVAKETSPVYIHTSSSKSFFRKTLFLLIAALFSRKVLLHIHPTHYFLLSRVFGFVVLSQEMRQNIEAAFPDKPVYVLRNPLDSAAMRPAVQYSRSSNKLVFLGWYIKEKGVYDLVDAVNILLNKGVELNLYFYGRKQIRQLRKYVQEKGVADRVSVNGWVDGEDKLRVLYTATMLVLPSHSEGIPNVILEAMGTRTPIVSTCVGGLKEILKDGENAIIANVGDPVDLSNKIQMCLENEWLRKVIADNAYRQAVTQYDVSLIAEKFKNIIRALTSVEDNEASKQKNMRSVL